MIEYKRKKKLRGGISARDIGLYNAHDKDGWNDEVLIGAQESEPQNQAEALIKDAKPLPKENEEEQIVEQEVGSMVELAPRVTEADRSRDERSLNRQLQRTLYLVVQDANGQWKFPEAANEGRESIYLVRR